MQNIENTRQFPKEQPAYEGLRGKAQSFVEARRTQYAITILIIVNAIILGLETVPSVVASIGDLMKVIDQAILAVFVAELLFKLGIYRQDFFRNGWNLFDSFVIGMALIPANEGTSILRALRIIRALRLISVVPSMRKVTQSLLRAIPGMGAVVSLLVLVFYVSAVMTTKLFGASFPDWFGDLGKSAYSLFQIMTLESWSMGIVRPVMEVHPYAWVFFVPFILIVTFAVLNLFIAIIVNAMDEERDAMDRESAAPEAAPAAAPAPSTEVLETLIRLEDEVRALRRQLSEKHAG